MKYVLLIVLALMIATVAFVFGWFGSDSKNVVVNVPVVENQIVNEAMDENEIAEEERYAAILAEYKKLEKRIKGVMWNVELPAEQAEEIVSKIRKGYALLKSKKLLGAFSGLESISDELARVEYTYQDLEGVVEEIKAAKSGT